MCMLSLTTIGLTVTLLYEETVMTSGHSTFSLIIVNLGLGFL